MSICNPRAMRRFFFVIFFISLVQSRLIYAQDDTARSVEMMCGGTRVQLTCGQKQRTNKDDNRICNNNTLFFELYNKTRREISMPPLFDPGSSAMGISCSKGSDGLYYVFADYRNGSCETCRSDAFFMPDGTYINKAPAKIVLQKHLKLSHPITIETLPLRSPSIK